MQRAKGFFLNVSNFQTTSRQLHYGSWISGCIAYATNPADGGWRLGHFDYCASQYYPRDGDRRVHVAPHRRVVRREPRGRRPDRTHFVIDTSRNGQGPWAGPGP